MCCLLLTVDMAVFRDLLRLKLPRLSQHLHHLQKAANREAGGMQLCVYVCVWKYLLVIYQYCGGVCFRQL